MASSLMFSGFPAVTYGILHIWRIERNQNQGSSVALCFYWGTLFIAFSPKCCGIRIYRCGEKLESI